MPQHQLRPTVRLGFVDKARATSKSVPTSASSVATPANYASETSINARLTAISGLYTAARLDQMTLNDKIFALRSADDPGSL